MFTETQYTDSGGVSIASQVLGDRPIELVYVPGFVSHLEYNWELPANARFLRRLASFSRLHRSLRDRLIAPRRPAQPGSLAYGYESDGDGASHDLI